MFVTIRDYGFAWSVAATGAILTFSSIEVEAQRATPYSRALAQCRAGQPRAPENTPTRYACNWPEIVRGAPGGSLMGRYRKTGRVPLGEMTILDRADGTSAIAITTVGSAPARRTCLVRLLGKRGLDDALVAMPGSAPSCTVSIRSTATRNQVAVSVTPGCEAFCGLGAFFDGTYTLGTR